MSDGILVISIVAFFLAAVLLVWACARVTAGAADDGEPEAAPEHEPGPT